ncbi:ParB N-terminal domain-containing protein [Nonomuraea sp. NPDC046802]|uniref:ParB N-terminal domain-containing protein n=1 Tax=Nonomuraea sp. NPDC046802 TaxID=3154919 RepID=UPI0033DE9314
MREGVSSAAAADVVPYGGVHEVSIEALLPADSPRSDGIDEEHVGRLMECLTELPPIWVHRPTMRVIDGMHRLHAATRAKCATIAARFFDGDEEEAFAHAVELNVKHGLHLSLADRKAAARRILGAFPASSDRGIAKKVGLSDKTVAAIRRGIADADPSRHDTRIGQDGHRYPVAAAQRRDRVAQIISERPSASLRVIAAAAGVSPGTVSKVRRQLETVPVREPTLLVRRGAETVMEKLRRDPALRDKEAGRQLLRWLSRHVPDASQAPDLSALPPHCLAAVAQLAQQAAQSWLALAHDVEAMVHESEVSP